MKPIEEFGIVKGGNLTFESRALGIARVSIVGRGDIEELALKLTELQMSYFNQMGFAIKTYVKLTELFNELNSVEDKSPASEFSHYDLKAEELRDDIEQYAYLLIVSLKTMLDLLVAVVDFGMYKIPRVERAIPDISSYSQRTDSTFARTIQELVGIKDNSTVVLLKGVRDNIVHRGFMLKLDVGFVKQSDLVFRLIRGIGRYKSEEPSINIGELFAGVMSALAAADERIGFALGQELSLKGTELSAKGIFIIQGGTTIMYHDGISEWS